MESSACSQQTSTILGDSIYVIGGLDEEESLLVQIFDKSTEKWTNPAVLGSKPGQCQGHSAELLKKDRILIIARDSTPDDCIWFLEVDSQFVREQKKILDSEVVAWSKGVKGDSAIPVVISGPSGVGKGTLISKLMKEFPSAFGFSVSHTTRAPRGNEKDGVHYHFTEQHAMEKAIREGKFLEFASVHGNLYGTSIEAVEAVEDAGKRCILDIDFQGAKSVKASSLEAIFISICPPSFEELERRLRARGTETEEQIQKRLKNARDELEQGRSPGLFDHNLVNDDLEKCYGSLKKLLGLNGSIDLTQFSSPNVSENSSGKSISGISEKFLVQLGKASQDLFMLDVSSLKGGAPGRTRGLKLHPVENPSEINLDDQIKVISSASQ